MLKRRSDHRDLGHPACPKHPDYCLKTDATTVSRLRAGRANAYGQRLAAETGEQVLRVDGLGQNFELMALNTRAIEKIGSRSLA